MRDETSCCTQGHGFALFMKLQRPCDEDMITMLQMTKTEDQGLNTLPNITNLEKVTEQAFVRLQTRPPCIHPPALSIWERSDLRPSGWA